MPADEGERLLIDRIRRGDQGAWEECISRYEGRLLAFVHSRLGDRAASEDVVQDAFLGFLISLPNYDEATPLESWLFTLTAHKLTDTMRRKGRRPALPLMAGDSEAPAREPAGTARAASSLMRSRERRTSEEEVIGRCLHELIAQWKERGEVERLMCIELLFVGGLSNKDAARRLGISEQAVANHKHFVVTKLKEAATVARLRDFEPRTMGIE